jgi:Flp pilus assembly protein TadG
MPALCLFMFGIIEVGYALWMQNSLDYSVATAARCASLTGSATNSPCNGKLSDGTYAASLSGATIAAANFTYSAPGCGCQVSGTYSMGLDIPWTNLSVTLSSEACYPLPQNRTPPQTCPAS